MRRITAKLALAAVAGCSHVEGVGKALDMPMNGEIHEHGYHPSHPDAPAEGKAVAPGDDRSYRKSTSNAVNGRYVISFVKPNDSKPQAAKP